MFVAFSTTADTVSLATIHTDWFFDGNVGVAKADRAHETVEHRTKEGRLSGAIHRFGPGTAPITAPPPGSSSPWFWIIPLCKAACPSDSRLMEMVDF